MFLKNISLTSDRCHVWNNVRHTMNTHVLALKSSFFCETEEKLELKKIVKTSRLTFQHNFWFICGPCLLFWCCPTRFETRALSARGKQCWIKSLFGQTLPDWSNRQNNIPKLAYGHKWHVTPVVSWTPHSIRQTNLTLKWNPSIQEY